MPELKIKQLRFECESWKRTLAFITNENVQMKLRVSEVLRDRFNQVLLGDIEQFQNRFIAMDDLICLLKNDIAKVERLIPSDPHFMHTSIDRIVQTSKTSRSNLEAAQIRLRRLTADFNDFLLEKS